MKMVRKSIRQLLCLKVIRTIGYKQLKALSGQGAVYIRLVNKDQVGTPEKEVVKIPDTKEEGTDVPKQYSASPACPPTKFQLSTSSQLAQLKQMFPSEDESYLRYFKVQSHHS